MAEDRERFRDLLDRIGQPYAPSAIVEGATDADARSASADAALAEIGLPAIVRPAFTLGGTGGGIVETEDAYRERIRAGLRASPIGQVMVEKCLVGWQEIEYEVMRDADDTCIAVCSMENVDPLGVHTGDSIVVAPVQTLPDPVHQRLRSAALAIIRALGVEGGCNVQFALSPDSTDYAVIEVNPRVVAVVGPRVARRPATRSPGSPPRSRSGGARRDPERRHRHDRRRVRAGPRLRRRQAAALPVRQVPDRRPDARQPDEGDRRGDGDRPDVRLGAEQGAPRPRAGRRRAARRGPELDAELRLPRRRSTAAIADARGRRSRSAGSTRPARPASRPATPSEPPRRSSSRRFLAPSDSRLWRLLGLLRRGVPEATIQEATGIAPWFLAEMGRNVALEAEVRAIGRAGSRDPRRTARRPTLLATVEAGGLRRPRARDAGRGRGGRTSATPAWRSACGPATRWSTPAPPSSPPRRRTSTRPTQRRARSPRRRRSAARRPSSSASGPGPDRAGDRVRLLRGPGRRHAPRAGWQAVMINSNPETVSTDFDASSRLYFEPLDAGERPERRSRPRRGTGEALAPGGRRVRRPDAAQPRRAARRRRRPAARQRPRGDRPGRGADALLRAARPARHPPARGRHGPQHRGGADARRADRLPGHRPAELRHRRPRDRLLLLARGPRPAARRGDRRRPRPAGPDRPLPRGRSRSTSTRSATASGS